MDVDRLPVVADDLVPDAKLGAENVRRGENRRALEEGWSGTLYPSFLRSAAH